MNTYKIPDEQGYYGRFGGAFIPEMLHRNLEELRTNYKGIIDSPEFREELVELLQTFAGRPTPLYKAKRLSQKFGTQIYLKREDLCHTGAHKINNTIGQVLLAERLGKTRIIAETGAGQHGVATATVCALKGLECIVYMGERDMERQAPNVARMKMLGAKVVPAISGSKTLKDATNEAIRDWINHPADTYYLIGSVVGPHPYPDMVAGFQSVISEEITWKMIPSHVIACVGGGSNAAGAFYHFADIEQVKLYAVEAAGASSTVLGRPGVLHGSMSLLMQTEDGQVVEPHSISAGLDYPGIGPMHAHLFETGRVHFLTVDDAQALQAGMELARLEGIIPALESAHALAALEQIECSTSDQVVVCLSGRGDKDLSIYMEHL